ncbi:MULTISPECIES: FimV/HubP family polar landmark protein [unclassified Acinetobacter]|uniref:FimV/HubP family polar landmark protein n=1 Tax=unclassified Acinetobacter TaxID=196816 RepID=UPI00257679F2|nr:MULTISPECIES: FimV/HubP family polar landmark protein [unclassified Acinetobacter]MDM1763998.1 hypothetical protein [Acinetobacter sp. 226-1]MDM1767732.1 hypothetical protein [Acinetobacter sp. 226-4]
MLLYIIPFVLLLVVAIVLKKRESSNNDAGTGKTNKATNKKTAKKNVAKTARSSQRQSTEVVETPVVAQEKFVEISSDLKQKIENLIKEKNYSAAEAQINLALNQDNRQHSLYLYLLDIHLAQKDDFAVNQLIQFIGSLGLEDILKQAEEKRALVSTQKIDAIEFEPSTTPVIPVTAAPIEKSPVSSDAFDSLVDVKTQTNNSFDLLQNEYSPSTKTEAAPTTLDFTPSSAPTIEVAQPTEVSTEVADLDFTLAPVEKKDSAEQSTAHEALDFSFGLDTTTPSTPEPVTENTVTTDSTPLEFSFDLSPQTTPTPVAEASPQTPDRSPTEMLTEFKMDFDAPTQEAPSVEASSPTLEFKLDHTNLEDKPSFSFDAAEPSPVELAPQTIETLHTTDTLSFSTDDPLTQAFPELLEVNELALNLDLAEQYIDLGAYASAREILSQNADQFSPTQREQSQSLLNRIAS